jgi:sulfite exporter TauE/SafE
MSKIKGILVLCLLGFLLWLYISASKGDTGSIAVLAVFAAVFLILLGVGITLAVLSVHYRREQMRFNQNVGENLAIMSKMQQIQNQQNAMLLKQAREVHKALPAGNALDIDALVVDDSVFSELEEGNR